MASRPRLGLVLLAGARLLARDPRLPLLHDHRPEDDPRRAGRAPGVRRRDRAARGAADRAADDGVREQGRGARRPRARVRGAAAARAARRRGRALAAGPRAGLGAGIARRTVGAAAFAGAAAFIGLLVLAGIPARSSAGAAMPPAAAANELLAVTITPSEGLAPIDRPTAQRIARDVVADLRIEADALRRRDLDRATAAADGARLAQRCGGRSESATGAPSSSRTTASSGSASRSSPARARRRRRSSPSSRARSSVATLRGVAAHRRESRRRRPLHANVRAHARAGPLSDRRLRGWRPSASRPASRPLRGTSAASGFATSPHRSGSTSGTAPSASACPAIRAGDDGRRPVLARLRRRRLARPVRRQLVLGRRHRRLAGAWRPAARRALPERAREVRRREPGLGRGPAPARERLRGGGLRPRRTR